MQLSEYLKKENKRPADLARDLDVRHCVVLRWVRNQRMPTVENMQKIVAYTGGEVMPNDFYNINENEKELNDVQEQTTN